jgi:hypothetical protein
MKQSHRKHPSQPRGHGPERRQRGPSHGTVLLAGAAIPGMVRVVRNVERRATSRRLCI